MIKVLMIGTFLSGSTGTNGASEKVMNFLGSESISIISASNKVNQILRMLEILYKCFFLNYDIIHIDTFSGRAFKITEVATLIGRARRKKIWLSLHGGMLPEFYHKYPKRFIRAISRASEISTPSYYLQTFFRNYKIELKYLPNSINLTRFPYDRSKVILHSILWVRAFSPIYNPHLAVLTVYEVRRTFPDATLTMIGPDKGLLPEIKKLISKLNLDSAVSIIGSIKNEDLYSYYQSHEVYLNTTSYESFGVALIEAASCGVPIVSSKVGEIPFLYTHGESIIMVDSFEPTVFAQQISRLFESTSLEEKLSKNARKIAERFDWGENRDQYMKIISI